MMKTSMNIGKKNISLLLVTFLLCPFLPAQMHSAWPTTNFGMHKVGFTNVHGKTKSGEAMLISIWYPAEGGGHRMTLRDYISASAVDKNEPDSIGLKEFKRVLELPFLFHLSPIAADEYEEALSTVTNTYRDAEMVKKKFPLVITFCAPQNYITSFEILASNGFCVASVSDKEKDETNDSLYYVKPTMVFSEFLDYMWQQPFVDTSRVSAMGHGWGIQAPFYLAMKTTRIRQLINLDGAVFGPRSKTYLSPDYHPSQLTIPMLHITTVSTRHDEDPQQFAVLNNPRYRINILSDSVSHHDFSTYGRVVGNILNKRPSIVLINKTYDEVHKLILCFLQKGRIDPSLINAELVEFRMF
jgi:hypothetical protein